MIGLLLSFLLIYLSSYYYSIHAQQEEQQQQHMQCHPLIDDNKSQYIIGYGSLIDEVSKRNTDGTAGTNYPILLSGYERSWSIVGNLPGFNTIFLGVELNTLASLNGVIYKTMNILAYDKREYVYCRSKVNESNMVLLNKTTNNFILDNNREIWIYISKYVRRGTSPSRNIPVVQSSPSRMIPVVQSYVDIFIRGCINISRTYKYVDDNYAKMCITLTNNWPIRKCEWINDRIYPRRPLIHEPMAREIDELLRIVIPNSFKIISFERYNCI